jgi:YVTN family beta-propeller protein
MPSNRFAYPVFFAAAAAALAFLLGAARAQQCPPIAAPVSSGYHLLKTIPLGGEGRWDLLEFDSATRRLFISRSTKVVVLNVDTEQVVGEIPDTQGVHGIALAPDLGRGFTSNGGSNTVTIFDLATLQVIGTASTGDGPDAIVYDPASKRVFTMNGRGKSATAIDAATGTVAGTFPLGGKPEFAVADGEGDIYANLEDLGEQVDIDTRKLAVTARWPIGGCESPSGLAIDREKKLLFTGCDNKVMAILGTGARKTIKTLPIGPGVDANAFDPGTGFAFSSNGGDGGTLTVVHEDSKKKFSLMEDVPTQQGARTMALDPKTHEVYLVTAKFGPAPDPTADQPHPRAPVLPDTFVVLVFGR